MSDDIPEDMLVPIPKGYNMRTNLWLKDPEKRHQLAIRKNAGRTIKPETATFYRCYAVVADPYGIEGHELPGELQTAGRMYFVLAPERAISVCFHDLPARLANRAERAHRMVHGRVRAN